jgi:beta-lactamase regulating signal transducer with metallopeptidase domain
MSFIDTCFPWLVTMVGQCLIVLAVGSVLTWCWSRPIERIRCIQATVIAAALTCLLQPLNAWPQIHLAWLPAVAEQPAATGTATTNTAAAGRDAAASNPGRAELPQMSRTIGAGPANEVKSRRQHATPIGMRSSAIAASEADEHQDFKGAANTAAAHAPVEASSQPPALNGAGWQRGTVLHAVPFVLAVVGACWGGVWLGIGLARMRGLLGRCQPASPEVQRLLREIQAGSTRPVTLLTSTEIQIPFTYGIRRAVIVLPASVDWTNEPAALRYCLAHEWFHVCRYDVLYWWSMLLLEPFAWFQPLYWLLRRELRICQDQLADQFAANLSADPISYAGFLVKLARIRQRRETTVALAISQGRSSLSRRVLMLLSDRRRFAGVCRPKAVFASACVLALVCAALGAVKLQSAQAQSAGPKAKADTDDPSVTKVVALAASNTDKDPKASNPGQDAKASKPAPPRAQASKVIDKKPEVAYESPWRPDGSLFFSGVVQDKVTKKPIRGAHVHIHRMILKNDDRSTLEDTDHTTDDQGRYSFVVSPKHAARSALYIEVTTTHENYASKGPEGYAMGMILKNLKLGDPPFYSLIELDPAEPLTGRVVDADGKPLAGVPVLGYSKTGKEDRGVFEYGSFFHGATGPDGRFRLNMVKGGPSVFWVVPPNATPRQIISGKKRGEWGDIRVEKGVAISGQVVDALGKPVGGVWVELTDQKAQGEIQMPVASAIVRSAQSGSDGRFKMNPLKPGTYELVVREYDGETRAGGPKWRDQVNLPAVFPHRKVSVAERSKPLLVQAVPHVWLDAQILDSKGKPRGGHEGSVFGKLDGEFYFSQLKPDKKGHFHCMIPHGLEDAKIDFSTNEHGALRIRLGKGKPLVHGRQLPVGNIQHDLTGIEVIRYDAPIVLVKMVDASGKLVATAKVAAIYDKENNTGIMYFNAGKSSSMAFEKQPDGRYRTSQMLPDEKTRFVASADGYEDAKETLSMVEGKTRELTLVLKPKPEKPKSVAKTDVKK